jgi:hypothetical protein
MIFTTTASDVAGGTSTGTAVKTFLRGIATKKQSSWERTAYLKENLNFTLY